MKIEQWRKEIVKADCEYRQELLSDATLNRVEFTAQETVMSYAFPRLWKFEKGDTLVITTPLSVSEIEQEAGEGGPWGCGGFTSRFIASIALRFENPQNGETSAFV